jgi:hypothetical protein
VNQIIQCDALEGMAELDSDSIPLVVTSPPWGKTRIYGQHLFDFESIACELWRVTAPGGIVCWHHQDQTEDGSLSCEHCHQLLYFRDLGFRVYEALTIVCHAYKPLFRRHFRLTSQIYVLSKGKPGVVNRLMIVRNANAGASMSMGFRDPDGYISRRLRRKTREIGYNGDVWQYDEEDGLWEYEVGWGKSCEDKQAQSSPHGAIMPWQLASDLIRTYSRPGTLVLDVCGGTGTTGVAALMTGRQYLLFEPWGEAIFHARRRLTNMTRRLILNPPHLGDVAQRAS